MVNFQIKYGKKRKTEKRAINSYWITWANIPVAVSIDKLWTYAIARST